MNDLFDLNNIPHDDLTAWIFWILIVLVGIWFIAIFLPMIDRLLTQQKQREEPEKKKDKKQGKKRKPIPDASMPPS